MKVTSVTSIVVNSSGPSHAYGYLCGTFSDGVKFKALVYSSHGNFRVRTVKNTTSNRHLWSRARFAAVHTQAGLSWPAPDFRGYYEKVRGQETVHPDTTDYQGILENFRGGFKS